MNQPAKNSQVGGMHYVAMPVQPWDVIDTWPIEQQIGFHRGNAMKYLMRLGAKDSGPQEARKAAHYCQKLAEVLERLPGTAPSDSAWTNSATSTCSPAPTGNCSSNCTPYGKPGTPCFLF